MTPTPQRSASVRIRPERIRITQVGLWFVVVTLLVGVTATNTGNNSLYLVFALLLGILVISGIVSRLNLRRIALSVEPPGEVFAGQPATFGFELVNTGRLLPRWLILLSMDHKGAPRLVPYLPPRARHQGAMEREFDIRGRHTVKAFHLTSVFPIGLFRKGGRIRVDEQMLVYPRLLSGGLQGFPGGGRDGDRPRNKRGWGHEVHGFRSFLRGDDPRSIHWKRSAQTGELVFTERVEEDGRRVTVALDNASSSAPGFDEAFERAVSEAATAAVHWLQRDVEVRLVTRDGVVPWGGGQRQRQRILQTLALVELTSSRRWPLPLVGDELMISTGAAAAGRVGEAVG